MRTPLCALALSVDSPQQNNMGSVSVTELPGSGWPVGKTVGYGLFFLAIHLLHLNVILKTQIFHSFYTMYMNHILLLLPPANSP